MYCIQLAYTCGHYGLVNPVSYVFFRKLEISPYVVSIELYYTNYLFYKAILYYGINLTCQSCNRSKWSAKGVSNESRRTEAQGTGVCRD